jgi:preprotein translocase subunit SecE
MPDIEAKAKEKSIEKKEKPRNKRLEGLKRFFVETRAEFRKIVWPTPKQTFNQTLVVILAIVIIGAFIWGLDSLTSSGIRAVLKNY